LRNRLCSQLKNDGSLKRGMFGKKIIYTATKKRRNARHQETQRTMEGKKPRIMESILPVSC
jgi:hypothetical protein